MVQDTMQRLSDNGKYIIGRLLGSGGQGQVFEGRQLDLDRKVAIKLLYDGDQVRHEAKLLGSLRHPHILQVHELIQIEDQPALVMEFVEGMNLAQLMADVELSDTHAEQLWMTVVDAVAHAHGCGIIHGDLSPSNVLIEVRKGRAHPMICDFGVGRSKSHPKGARGSTEGFVAPERRNGSEPTAASDVYSLGALGRYVLPGECRTLLDEALAIAMTSDPGARPQTAADLAGLLNGTSSPVAPPLSTETPLIQAPSVSPWIAGLGGAIAAGAVLIAVWTALSTPKTASVDPTLALAASERWTSNPTQAAALWHAAGALVPPRVRAIGADGRILPHDSVVTVLTAYGDQLITADENGVLRKWNLHDGTMEKILDTQNSHPSEIVVTDTYIAVANHTVYGSNDSQCLYWNRETQECAYAIDSPVSQVLHDPTTNVLWYSTRLDRSGAVDLTTNTSLWETKREPHSIRATLIPAVPTRVAQIGGERLTVTDLMTGDSEVLDIDDFDAQSQSLHWSGEELLWSNRETIFATDLHSNRRTQMSTGHLLSRSELGWVHSGGRSQVGQWHTDDAVWPIRHRGWYAPVAWGGKSLLTVTPREGSIEMIDSRDGHVQRTLLGHTRPIIAMTVIQDWLVTSSLDRTVRLWRPVDKDIGWIRRVDTGLTFGRIIAGERVAIVGRRPNDHWTVWTDDHPAFEFGWADTATVDPSARYAGTGHADGRFQIADLRTGERTEFPGSIVSPRCMEISVEHNSILMSNIGEWNRWRLDDQTVSDNGPLATNPSHCAFLGPRGGVWLVGGEPATVELHDSNTSFDSPFDRPVSMAGFEDGTLHLFGFVGQLAVQRNSKFEVMTLEDAVSAATHGDATVWTGDDGAVFMKASGAGEVWSSGTGSRVRSLAFAADGRLVLAGRNNGVLDMWDRQGVLKASIQAHDTRIVDIAVAPDSGHIITLDLEGIAQWWEPARLLSHTRDISTNLRVCKGTERIVEVIPFPQPEDRWAPPSACEEP